MNIYLAVEWIVIAVLLALSLRTVWVRVLKPAFNKPKAGCGSGCNSCASSKLA